jgi:hypothetical protein
MCGRFAGYGTGMEYRGCAFCREDRNMHFGSVSRVASSEWVGVLLRCPRCGWLYLDPRDGFTEPFPIEGRDAFRWFDYST